MLLKKSVISRIRQHRRLKTALMDKFEIGRITLYRWLNDNDPQFTEYSVLLLIGSYLGVDDVQDLLDRSEEITR